MIFPEKFIKVGKCIAKMKRDGSPMINKRPIVKHDGNFWIGARLSYHLNVENIPRTLLGKKSKEGLCLHKCNNGWCINPEHLYIGSKSMNQKDFYKTNEGKQKIEILRVWRKETPRSEESIKKSADWHRGRKRSEQTRINIGKSRKYKPHTQETKAKISATLLAKSNKNGKI